MSHAPLLAHPTITLQRVLLLCIALLSTSAAGFFPPEEEQVRVWTHGERWSDEVAVHERGEFGGDGYRFSVSLRDPGGRHVAEINAYNDIREYTLRVVAPWPHDAPPAQVDRVMFFTQGNALFSAHSNACNPDNACIAQRQGGLWQFLFKGLGRDAIDAFKVASSMVVEVHAKDRRLAAYVVPMSGSARAIDALDAARNAHFSTPDLDPALEAAKGEGYFLAHPWDAGERWRSEIDVVEHDDYQSYVTRLRDDPGNNLAEIIAFSDEDNYFNVRLVVDWHGTRAAKEVHSLVIHHPDGRSSTYRNDCANARCVYPQDSKREYVFRIRALPLAALREMANGKRMELLVVKDKDDGVYAYDIPLRGSSSAIRALLAKKPGGVSIDDSRGKGGVPTAEPAPSAKAPVEEQLLNEFLRMIRGNARDQ